MLFVYDRHGRCIGSGHIGSSDWLPDSSLVARVQADGDELWKAWAILGRNMRISASVYKFFGDNAKEIVANWR